MTYEQKLELERREYLIKQAAESAAKKAKARRLNELRRKWDGKLQ